jgi:hypothetical protein
LQITQNKKANKTTYKRHNTAQQHQTSPTPYCFTLHFPTFRKGLGLPVQDGAQQLQAPVGAHSAAVNEQFAHFAHRLQQQQKKK